MPNQPKTPVRSFRLPEQTTAQLRQLSETLRTTMTGAVVHATATSAAFAELLAEDEVTQRQAAFRAADEASWFDVHMPRDEARRRLAAALSAASPFIEAEARRQTLLDVVDRLSGFGVDPEVIEHFRQL